MRQSKKEYEECTGVETVKKKKKKSRNRSRSEAHKRWKGEESTKEM
jgi:hypothetical protein